MKLNFKKVNGKYFHHKKTDGELLMLLQQGFGRDVIVIRHLYKSKNQVYHHSMDIRYFHQKVQDVYIQSKNGIQIKSYLKFGDWILEVMKKCISVIENISVNKSDIRDLNKYKKIYREDVVYKDSGINKWL